MGICGSRLYLMSIFFFFFFFSISSLPGWSAWFLNSLVSRGTFGNGTIRIRKRRIIKKWNERDEVVSMLGGEGGQKEGYMCTSILYILEKISGRKTSLFFLKNTFWTSILMIRRNRYDDQAHSSFSFSFSSSCTQVQCWLILLLPNNFPNDLEFMQLMTRSRLDRQTELYALSSCNSHSSWDRKQDHVFLLW